MGQRSRAKIGKVYTAKLTSAKTVLFSSAQRQPKIETQSDGHPILGQAKNNIYPPSSYLVLSPSNHLLISSYYLVLLSSRHRIIPSSRHLITSSSHHVIISSSHHTVNRTCLKGSLIVLALKRLSRNLFSRDMLSRDRPWIIEKRIDST